jgi:predicted nucleic acid-binding protein
MPAGPVVSNNTPLVALWSLDALHLLRALYGEVLIPLAVRDEFLDFAPVLRADALAGAHWIKPVAFCCWQKTKDWSSTCSRCCCDS